MARTCTVCAHPDRDEIDHKLVAGMPLREISRLWPGVSKDAAFRHKEAHLPTGLVALQSRQEQERGSDLGLTVLERVEGLTTKLEAALDRAEESGRDALFFTGARELRAALELLGKLTGELREGPKVTINLLSSEQFVRIQVALAEALSPWPEAKWAAAQSLDALEES